MDDREVLRAHIDDGSFMGSCQPENPNLVKAKRTSQKNSARKIVNLEYKEEEVYQESD
jgi:hypothetical protein